MFLPDPCWCRCASRHLRTSLDTHATRGFGRLQGVPMMVRQRTEAGMAAGGRGAFRNETRATRLERLHGPMAQRRPLITTVSAIALIGRNAFGSLHQFGKSPHWSSFE
jgi:hypothetical protein